MAHLIANKRYGPIGVEIDSRSVQMMQFTGDRKKLVDAVRWDVPRAAADEPAESRATALTEAVRQAREGRKFRGRDVVVCLNSHDLFVQNIRVPKGPATELNKVIQQEAASRLPFPATEAEIRYLCAGEVRQGEQVKREIVLLACHQPAVDQVLAIVDGAGFRAVAVDVEPSALLRVYSRQFRRDDDKGKRMMFVRLGTYNTTVVISQDMEVFFIKYIDVGGDQLDEAVSRHLKISLEEAVTLRRHNGDRRGAQQDAEVATSVSEATRPVIERLIGELALCIRYHSVTFRGHSINRLVLGGSEASASLVETLCMRLDVKCELGDPLRSFETPLTARRSQWDVTAGLALREFNN